MAWIKIDQTLRDHKKVLSVSDDLDVDPVKVTGMLVLIWLWSLDNAPNGSLEGISNRSIARAAQWDGDADEFVEALKNARLLDVSADGGLSLHDWYEYAGKLIEKRETERERSRLRRAKANGQAEDDHETTNGQPTDEQTDDRAETVGKEKSESRVRVDSLSSEANASEEAETPAADPVPYEIIKNEYHDRCPSYPRVRKLSANRKKAIAARYKEYKGNLATFLELFDMAEASPFLKGQNGRNWSADFDWLMKSDNMAKVLEGKYNDARRPQPIRTGSAGGSTLDVLGDIIAEQEGGMRA